MTFQVIKGDLFNPGSFRFNAIGHGVNTKGVMGAGIAVLFRRAYPEMYERYVTLCKYGILQPGTAYVYDSNFEEVWNLASQDFPGSNASQRWYAQALVDAVEKSRLRVRSNIGLPLIGAGIGGLTKEESLEVVRDVADLYPGYNFTVVEL